MREFLSARHVPFVERNIRQDPEARAELLRLTGKLVVPVVVAGERYAVGYDLHWLESMISTTGEEPVLLPPRDSASPEQGTMAANPQDDLASTVSDLVIRIREEQAYNVAKGGSPYRQGMHDGLRFAEDALVTILKRHARDEIHLPEPPIQVRRLDV